MTNADPKLRKHFDAIQCDRLGLEFPGHFFERDVVCTYYYVNLRNIHAATTNTSHIQHTTGRQPQGARAAYMINGEQSLVPTRIPESGDVTACSVTLILTARHKLNYIVRLQTVTSTSVLHSKEFQTRESGVSVLCLSLFNLF